MKLLCLLTSMVFVSISLPSYGHCRDRIHNIDPPPAEDIINGNAARRSAVAGDDLNGNGVRDDIESWAYANFPMDTAARAVVLQLGAVMQKVLLSGADVDELTANGFKKEIKDGLECMFASTDDFVQKKIFKELLELILNTPERAAIIAHLEEKYPEQAGTTISSPSISTCKIQPDLLSHKGTVR